MTIHWSFGLNWPERDVSSTHYESSGTCADASRRTT